MSSRYLLQSGCARRRVGQRKNSQKSVDSVENAGLVRVSAVDNLLRLVVRAPVGLLESAPLQDHSRCGPFLENLLLMICVCVTPGCSVCVGRSSCPQLAGVCFAGLSPCPNHYPQRLAHSHRPPGSGNRFPCLKYLRPARSMGVRCDWRKVYPHVWKDLWIVGKPPVHSRLAIRSQVAGEPSRYGA